MAKKRQPKDKLPMEGQPSESSYSDMLTEVKSRIHVSRIKAAISVNRELIQMYWDIGKAIAQRQADEGWGKSVVERLSKDLQAEFDGKSGFSPRNLWRMRTFYIEYSQGLTLLPQAVAVIENSKLPQAVAEIPWGHNAVIIEKLKDPVQRLWYATETTKNGWSRAVLIHQIESDAHARQGKAITSFQAALPSPQSDLAQQITKDPYNFEFLGLASEVSERELEQGLIDHLKTFLIELGKGFAFVGQQYRLEVGGQDFYLDLLFYHLHLGCYVIIDLKVEDFKPEFVGKMSFYLTAVDESLPNPADHPAIGLILCKQRNKTIVEYTLRDTSKPVGVATYSMVPLKMRDELPTAEELQDLLSDSAES